MNEETQPGGQAAPDSTATASAEASKPAKAKGGGKKGGAAKPKAKAKAKGATKGVKGPAVLRTYAPGYHKDKEKKTAGGNVSVDSNDKLAVQLRGKPLEDVYTQAAKVLSTGEKPVTVAELKKRYGKLNVGMQRMNLGNRMRGVLNAK